MSKSNEEMQASSANNNASDKNQDKNQGNFLSLSGLEEKSKKFNLNLNQLINSKNDLDLLSVYKHTWEPNKLKTQNFLLFRKHIADLESPIDEYVTPEGYSLFRECRCNIRPPEPIKPKNL